MKTFLCLFESPFEIEKNGVFSFEISFFISEILAFFYYANQISDDVTRFATKNGKILHAPSTPSTAADSMIVIKTIRELSLFLAGSFVSI